MFLEPGEHLKKYKILFGRGEFLLQFSVVLFSLFIFLFIYLFIYLFNYLFILGWPTLLLAPSIYVSHLGEYLATDYRLSIGKLATKYGQSVAVKYRCTIYRYGVDISVNFRPILSTDMSSNAQELSPKCRPSVAYQSTFRRHLADNRPTSVRVDAPTDMSTKCCGVNVRVYFRLLF